MWCTCFCLRRAEARRVPSSGWAQRREEGEHSKEHISEQQLLDYIQAADKEHFEGADLQVSGGEVDSRLHGD